MSQPRKLELEEIRKFSLPSEYDRFVAWIEQHVAEGNLVEVPSDPDYGPGKLFGAG